ncbi:hypothetical protein [Actinomyces respiraculi]|uniref:hypothetical protein n=1 Tax=Actinomyces respiraculi TaxID=2744574 RepID=UPI00141F55CB|nr:hypothetical protein [Actinomyces respiraculi]
MTTTPASAHSPAGGAETTELVEIAEVAETTELAAPTEVGQTAAPTEVVDPATFAEPTTQPFASPSAEPGPAEPTTQPGPATPSAQPGPTARVVNGVWTASHQPEPQAPRTLRPSTLSWGVLLVSIGVITLLIGLGVRINLATAGISVLVALGVLLLGLALLPQHGSERS